MNRASASRAPSSVVGLPLLKEMFDQVVGESHELPDDVTVLTRLTWGLALLTAAMLPVTVDDELRIEKPVSSLFQTVFQVKVRDPGFPLSMNPLFALENVILFLSMWLAGGLSVIPSLKPLPSPSKSMESQRLKPLLQE
ncbi:hypothetical protein SCAR479_00832 [Seiridium cardinale]|uniref:Uncharacterized protein n=1 Tax=Seiridium cardinale TaxID=138064 RepID=A0ABR2Y737_9PEZI